MRAPGEKFVTYSDARWQRIRAAVRAGLGIEVNEEIEVPGLRWSAANDSRGIFKIERRHMELPPDFALPKSKIALRPTLERIAARRYQRPEPIKSLPDLQERVDELREMLAEHGDEYDAAAALVAAPS
jgi:hypothetical protein